MRTDQLWPLTVVFVSFSLSSIGGGTSLFAPMHHQAVDIHQWITSQDFVDLFAISRAAPGPGSMLATLIGWKIDGLLGALVATLALFVPSSILVYFVARVWNRYRGRKWHSALEHGLAPIATGLISAGTLAIARVGGEGVLSWVVAVGSALILARFAVHPLFLLAAGAAIFAVMG